MINMTTNQKIQRKLTPSGIDGFEKNQNLGWPSATISLKIYLVETVKQFEEMPLGSMFYVARKEVVSGLYGVYGVKIPHLTRVPSRSNHTVLITRYVDYDANRVDECTYDFTGTTTTIEKLLVK